MTIFKMFLPFSTASKIWALLVSSFFFACTNSKTKLVNPKAVQAQKYFNSKERMTAFTSKTRYYRNSSFYDFQRLRVLAFSSQASRDLAPYLAREEDWPNKKIEPAHYRCFAPRGRVKPSQVVIHHTAATLDTTVRLFHECVRVRSAHFVITKQGKIITMVHPDDRAFHVQGLKNFSTVGIEVESGHPFYGRGKNGKPEVFYKNAGAMPEAQEKALIALVKFLVEKYNMPLSKNLVHSHDSKKNPFKLSQFDENPSDHKRILKQWYKKMFYDGYQHVYESLQAGEPSVNWQDDSYVKALADFYEYPNSKALIQSKNRAIRYWKRLSRVYPKRKRQLARIERRIDTHYTDLGLQEALSGINIHMASTPSARTNFLGSHITSTACPSFLFNTNNRSLYADSELGFYSNIVQSTRTVFFKWRKQHFSKFLKDDLVAIETKIFKSDGFANLAKNILKEKSEENTE